jgi:hypothetical protein
MTRTILCTMLAGGGVLAAAAFGEGRCTVSRDGTEVTLEHVYAVRIPDTFTDGATRIRVLCVSAPLDPAELASDDSFGPGWHAVHRGDRGGLLVELDAAAMPIYTVIARDGRSSQFSGPIWDVAFEGGEEEGRLRGRIETTEPLSFEEEEPGWTFVVEVDAAIVDVR